MRPYSAEVIMSIPVGNPAPSSLLSLERLAKTAQLLNTASDRLNDSIEQLNGALKKLNLGTPAWVSFSIHEEGPFCETEEIGYDKIKAKWGVGLRTVFEDQNRPDGENEEITVWHFSEAPREMRIRAVTHLHKLIEQLDSIAATATANIAEKTKEAEELAAAINRFVDAGSETKLPIRPVTGGKR
jgi:hypothetical protein